MAGRAPSEWTEWVTAKIDPDPAILLQPITVQQYGQLEEVLADLRSAVESAIADGSINQSQIAQLETILELAHDAVRDATPDKTPRWELFGFFRTVVKKYGPWVLGANEFAEFVERIAGIFFS